MLLKYIIGFWKILKMIKICNTCGDTFEINKWVRKIDICRDCKRKSANESNKKHHKINKVTKSSGIKETLKSNYIEPVKLF